MIMSSAAKTLESLTTDCLILFANYRKREPDYIKLPIGDWQLPIAHCHSRCEFLSADHDTP